jgi:Tat protein translocase TatB subunit
MNFTEIILLLIVGLIVFGPEELPGIARTVGKFMVEFRKVTGDLTKEFKDTLTEPLGDTMQTISEPMREVTQAIKNPLSTIQSVHLEHRVEQKIEAQISKVKEDLLTYKDASAEKVQEPSAVKQADPLKDLPDDMVTYNHE